MRSDLVRNVTTKFDEEMGGRMFLTFDLDWCSDEVLAFTLDILEEYDRCATFFVTHQTSLLDRIRANQNFELGIHPNFNFLLEGDFRFGKNYQQVIEHYLHIVPEAVSVRSHSLTQSSGILEAFAKCGLTHDCNLFLPPKGLPKPFLHWGAKLVRVPHIFEDDVECLNGWHNLETLRDLEKLSCIKVFNFHPIHIFLNTEHLERYQESAAVHRENDLLKNCVNTSSFGTRYFLIELLRKCT